MSDTDSFIEEVTEEVRRDHLFGLLRRYGWIAALVVVLIVGGAAFNEYRKAQAQGQAQDLGDAILAALQIEEPGERARAIADVTPASPQSAAILGLLSASAQAEAEDTQAAIASLDAVALNGDVPEMYRQVARFKSLMMQSDTLPAADRRQAFEAMAQPGLPLRLLASEQLALIDIAEGDTEAAITRYQALLSDAETPQDLQQRALQVIVALGGTPEENGAPAALDN
jgi:hypothetical protein